MRERMTKIRKVFHTVWQTHWIKVKNRKHQTMSRSFSHFHEASAVLRGRLPLDVGVSRAFLQFT